MRFNLGTVASRVVIVITGDASVCEAARLMREHHVGSLVVVGSAGEDPRPVGLVTDRDLIVEVLAQEVDPKLVKVADVMSPQKLVTAKEDDAVFDAIEAMGRSGVRRVVVVDSAGKLVGIVSMDDLIALLADELRSMAKALDVEIEAEKRDRPVRNPS